MSSPAMGLARRLVWHPATAAALIAVAAGAATVLPHGGADWPWPWLVVGTAAGFATSGST